MQTRPLLVVATAGIFSVSALAQSTAPCDSIAQSPGTLPTSAALRGTVPIEISNSHVFVPVCHGGRLLSFILDTGAPFSAFDLHLAEQQGIPLRDGHEATGVGAGSTSAATVDGHSVRLAGTAIAVNPIRAIDFSSVARRDGHRFDGLLGGDLMKKYVLRIDYAARTLELYDTDRFRYDGGGVTVPISLRGGYPYADAEVTLEDGGRVTGRFLVDVGSSQSVNFSKPWIEKNRLRQRIAPTVRARGGSGVGGATSHDIGRVPSMRLGTLVIPRPIVHLHGDSAGTFSSGSDAGSIGAVVLRHFNVVIDYKRRRLIFEPNAGTSEPFDADFTGLNLSLDSSFTRIVVDDVMADSPGSLAGLASGDTIVAVNGVATSSRTLDQLRTLFRKTDQQIELTIRRGNAQLSRRLLTRALLPPD